MKDAITLASRVAINEDVIFRDLEGEIVLLNLKTGVYFGLDLVGTRIWHLIREHQSLQKALGALLEEFEVAEARCAADLLSLVGVLREKGLVEVTAPAAG